jgi:tetratricopeptide (TPR) repeat protein
MSDPRQTQTFATADAASFLGTFALIFLTIAGLLVVDSFLARIDRVENRSAARHLYDEGMHLVEQGRTSDATERFRSAVSSERTNPVYQRALAGALLAAGNTKDAETVLTERLERDPTDGSASLIMARALAQDGRFGPAISYYHRAIYGEWENDAVANRVRARFELVDLLARSDSKQELLSELLPLQHEAPTDLATRRRIARLFTAAGSPSRAIEIFHGILRENGRDANAYAGLAEAELERGSARRAVGYLQTAARFAPSDPEIARQLALVNQILALNPTQRGLSFEEQLRRSRSLLNQIVVALNSCPGVQDSATVQPSVRPVTSSRAPRSAAARQQALESNLQMAEQLWDRLRRECPKALDVSAQPVAWVLDQMIQ